MELQQRECCGALGILESVCENECDEGWERKENDEGEYH